MATTKVSNAKTLWTYTTQFAVEYAIAGKTAYVGGADTAKFGGAAATVSLKSIPNGFRPRRVKCVAPDGTARWIIAYKEDATIWTTVGTTVTLNMGGVDTVFTSTDQTIGERAERKGKEPAGA
jgi:hypothetical protein